MFIRPRVCIRFTSYSTSRWTHLPSANSSYCQARSGLSQPSHCPLRASQKEIILTMRRALCSYTQIAEKTGLSVGAIKSYCYRNGLNTESLKSSSGFCKNCGKPILTPSKTRPRRFCSDACKTAWWNLHRYDHKNSSLIKQFKCNVCGKEFADYSSTQRKYCSRICYQKRGSQND